jgi:hypothetical protein
VGIEFSARLELAEIQSLSGDTVAAHSALERLSKDAGNPGFQLMSRKASKALQASKK